MNIIRILTVALLSLVMLACSGKSNDSASSEIIDKTVYFYSTSWCSYCKKARAFMDARDIDYIEYDIEVDDSAKFEHEELLGDKKRPGKVGVPLFVINGKVIHGFSEKRLERAVAAIH